MSAPSDAEMLRLVQPTNAERNHSPPAPSPDTPDMRTTRAEPAPFHGEHVHPGDVTTGGQAPEIALAPDILRRFRRDLRRAGLAGERTLAQLVYLSLTSRLLPWGRPIDRPVSVIVKGSTSTGKSHAVRTTLRFFPESAFLDLGSMSKRYLFYTEDEFAHRVLYVPEWASVREDDELVATLRTLLSEGRIRHGTVEGEGKRKARPIEKNGPTGLLVTTTDAAVDAEMETRCLSLLTDDTREQTRRVFVALAALEYETESRVEFAAWHEFQDWLASFGETRVLVPFSRTLARQMPTTATRLRRDFVTLLCLVRAHAILYREQRERDEHGRIVATIDGDYAPVRELVADLIAEGADASVSGATRQTVEAVRAILDDGAAHVSPTALTKWLGVGRSATYGRINRALVQGYLVNEASKGERPMRLVLGAALPGEQDFLPPPQALAGVVRPSPDAAGGHVFGSTMRPHEGMSTCPARPPDPEREGVEPDPSVSGDAVAVHADDADVSESERERLAALARHYQAQDTTHDPKEGTDG
jgi:hypothetical protein